MNRKEWVLKEEKMEYNFDSSVLGATIQVVKYNAEIDLGGTIIQLRRDKPFTEKQIKHIKEYFGFDARNLQWMN